MSRRVHFTDDLDVNFYAKYTDSSSSTSNWEAENRRQREREERERAQEEVERRRQALAEEQRERAEAAREARRAQLEECRRREEEERRQRREAEEEERRKEREEYYERLEAEKAEQREQEEREREEQDRKWRQEAAENRAAWVASEDAKYRKKELEDQAYRLAGLLPRNRTKSQLVLSPREPEVPYRPKAITPERKAETQFEQILLNKRISANRKSDSNHHLLVNTYYKYAAKEQKKAEKEAKKAAKKGSGGFLRFFRSKQRPTIQLTTNHADVEEPRKAVSEPKEPEMVSSSRPSFTESKPEVVPAKKRGLFSFFKSGKGKSKPKITLFQPSTSKAQPEVTVEPEVDDVATDVEDSNNASIDSNVVDRESSSSAPSQIDEEEAFRRLLLSYIDNPTTGSKASQVSATSTKTRSPLPSYKSGLPTWIQELTVAGEEPRPRPEVSWAGPEDDDDIPARPKPYLPPARPNESAKDYWERLLLEGTRRKFGRDKEVEWQHGMTEDQKSSHFYELVLKMAEVGKKFWEDPEDVLPEDADKLTVNQWIEVREKFTPWVESVNKARFSKLPK